MHDYRRAPRFEDRLKFETVRYQARLRELADASDRSPSQLAAVLGQAQAELREGLFADALDFPGR